MNLPDFLIRLDTGEIRLAGHRIGLFHIVHHYNDGYSAEMLAGQYPTLPLSLIHKVIAFYLENQLEVNSYVSTCSDQLIRQRASNSNRLDLATLRQRLETMQLKEGI